MKQPPNGYVRSRVLKMNVGFLLASGSGHSHETGFDVPAVRVSDDLTLDYLRGPLRLSRTKEGVLVQGELKAGVQDECYRCLDVVPRDVDIVLEELYAYPPSPAAEFSVGEDAILDLAPLLRDEVLIALSHGELCREDCKGLCPQCGTNLNHGGCTCADDAIDPRLAKLKELLNDDR